MRCKLCGSSAGKPRKNELNTQEVMKLCEQIRELKVNRISLMGGEPFIRNDWELVLDFFHGTEQEVEFISNGLLVDKKIAKKLRHYDIYGISFSLDGTEEINDKLRNFKGSYKAIRRAVETCQEEGLRVGIISQINKYNINSIKELYNILVEWQIDGWQIQLTNPLGNAKASKLIVDEDDIILLHDSILEIPKDRQLDIFFADDIGYFCDYEPFLRSSYLQNGVWLGCQAGLLVSGLTSDGGVKGCLSLPDEFIEDNVRKRSFVEIWNDKNLFSYNRIGHELHGFCRECDFAKLCKGGCSSLAYSTMGHLGEIKHCWHRIMKSRSQQDSDQNPLHPQE